MEEDPPCGAVDPEDAAAFLLGLEGVGLVGPKLATCHGSEESLAKQVAEHVGIEFKAAHVEFLRLQIENAVAKGWWSCCISIHAAATRRNGIP